MGKKLPAVTMSEHLMDGAHLIAALERAGWTSEMTSFVRGNRLTRKQIIELVKSAMPAKEQQEAKYVIELSKLHDPVFQRMMREMYTETWESATFEWAYDHTRSFVKAFGQLSRRNGEIFVRYFGIYTGVTETRASLAREYGLSATMVKTITDNARYRVGHMLQMLWEEATAPPPEPSLHDMELPVRIIHALERGGIVTPDQLMATADERLLDITGIGDDSLVVIHEQIEWYKNNKQ